jgi:hypothetical protein
MLTSSLDILPINVHILLVYVRLPMGEQGDKQETDRRVGCNEHDGQALQTMIRLW